MLFRSLGAERFPFLSPARRFSEPSVKSAVRRAVSGGFQGFLVLADGSFWFIKAAIFVFFRPWAEFLHLALTRDSEGGLLKLALAILAWNVRGLGNKETVRALRNSIQKFQPDIVFLSETKQQKRYLEKIRMKMKMEHSFYIEPNGIVGGLALWWSNDVQIKILKSGKHLIDAEISLVG
ncbi:hypothetical protein V6N11_040041 [Hibiscus sabdariffa]|uniref:Endonuclease/exonuclease/phosphatase domain-containing protein n=1 Tax=Hibiscus sabdariffa TaxID=183260 RepID=A0ABR2RG92_9ROSI